MKSLEGGKYHFDNEVDTQIMGLETQTIVFNPAMKSLAIDLAIIRNNQFI